LEQCRELERAAGIADERCTNVTVHHDAMPRWMALVDWGLLLLTTSIAKRGSMPTKLAEFFASGVRPVFIGCNEEVGRWVNAAGSGLVLGSTSDEELRAAAARISASAPDPELLRRARESTAPHFSLRSGVDRYDALLRAIA
jgi:hypothetical protein